MTRYKLNFSRHFQKRFKQITEKNKFLEAKIVKTLEILQTDPKYSSLHSHKVETLNYGERWSSRVTGDIRIIWDFDEDNNVVILVLDIGGHSGSGKVYQ